MSNFFVKYYGCYCSWFVPRLLGCLLISESSGCCCCCYYPGQQNHLGALHLLIPLGFVESWLQIGPAADCPNFSVASVLKKRVVFLTSLAAVAKICRPPPLFRKVPSLTVTSSREASRQGWPSTPHRVLVLQWKMSEQGPNQATGSRKPPDYMVLGSAASRISTPLTPSFPSPPNP